MKYLIALSLLTVNAYAGFTNINIGALPNDGTGDSLRIAFSKVNSNFWMAADTGYVASAIAGIVVPPQTNISYVGVTNAPWQWGSGNLSNWSSTAVFSTNGLQGALGYSPQLGSANLSNWSAVAVFSTNGLTGFDAVNLTNLQAAQITGVLPMGTVASGLTNIPGPFLTTNTAARYYSYNGNALTNLSAANLVSGTNTATIGIGSLAVPGAAGFVTANNGVVSLGANAGTAKIIADGTTGGQTNQGALVITNTSQANTFLALAGNQTGSSANVIEYKTNNVSKFSLDNNGNLTAGSLISTVVRSTGNAGWMLADNPVGGIPGLALNSSGRIYWALGPNWWSTLDLALTRATNATLVVQSNVVAMGTITATNGFYHYGAAGYGAETNGVLVLGANAAAAKITLDGVNGNITNGVTSVWNGTTHGVHIANGAIYGSSQTNFAGSFAAARGYIDFISGNGLAIGGSDGFGQEIKIVPDNRNQTTFSFGNANGTKTFRFLSDSNTFSGSVTATNGFVTIPTIGAGVALTSQGAYILSSSSQTITLPSAVTNIGKTIWIKNRNVTSTTVNTVSSQTIDGASTYSLPNAYSGRYFISDGANWLTDGVGL